MSDENFYHDFSNAELTPTTVEVESPSVSEKLKQLVADTLEGIHNRSFAGRHPELGKMINCVHCRSRHREHGRKCEQRFARRWIVVDGKKEYTDERLIVGETEETQSLRGRTLKQVLGAAAFAKKRRHPPLSRRQLMFVELVRKLIPDEYTQEDLKNARAKATRLLGMRERKTYGTLKHSKQNKMAR